MSQYPSTEIKVLSSAELIRRRPRMYLKPFSVESLINAALCWSLDEVSEGIATEICVALEPNGSISITDNGAGMPIDKAELLMTSVGACRASKRNNEIGEKHCLVSIVVMNALSEWCTLEILQGGYHFRQIYRFGEPITDLNIIGESTQTGTRIQFCPDKTIFSENNINVNNIINCVKNAASSVSGANVQFVDARC